MFKRSFKGKIIIPPVVVLVVLTTVLTIYVSIRFLHYSNALIDGKTATDAKSLRLHIRNGQTHTKAAAMSMARNLEALHAIKNRDRELILQIFKPMCEVYQVDYFTITDENGIVLVRTYEFEQAGDSILNQHNVQDAKNGHVATHLETGTRVKVAVRTGTPVYDTDGTLIGIISAGIRYDSDEAVDLMKQHLDADVTIFFGETNIATTILDGKKRRITGTVDSNVVKVIKEKTEYFGNADIFGEKYRTFYMPIIDAEGEVFAVFAIGYPLAEREAAAKALVRHIAIISFTGLAVSVVFLYWAVSTISKPLMNLSKEMNKVEGGNLSILIDSKIDDEVGIAAKSLRNVAFILHKLIDDINTAISEHERGNTEYRIDISGFDGVYRLLAERIVTLSSLGMEDQLTGLPNRRSFNNRLEMEWIRAMRENTPLSVLMIDVDKFKTYNDTYGHQQGDVALQTVAKMVSLPIKRGTDLAARWGGEEFIILLPHTNPEGASHVAESIRSQVENMEIPSLTRTPVKKVTVSIGVDTLIPTPQNSIDQLIAHADAALYRAKKTGRNRVC